METSIKEERGSLGTKAFLILRDNILNEHYVRGQKLNEVALAKELEISRTPIREALKQLELEGLVESIPNRGVYVLGFSSRDIDDMFEIRMTIEELGIQLAIDRMTLEQFNEVKDIYEMMEFFTERGDVAKVNQLNLQFHDAIYKATQSKYFSKLIKDITYYITVTSRHSLSKESRLETALQEHREIYMAIASRDHRKAREAIRNHLIKTRFLVKEYYQNKEQG